MGLVFRLWASLHIGVFFPVVHQRQLRADAEREGDESGAAVPPARRRVDATQRLRLLVSIHLLA